MAKQPTRVFSIDDQLGEMEPASAAPRQPRPAANHAAGGGGGWERWALDKVLLLLVAIGIIVFLTFPARWQYEVVFIPDADLVARMNSLGADGWDVVSARRATEGRNVNSMGYELILKRHR